MEEEETHEILAHRVLSHMFQLEGRKYFEFSSVTKKALVEFLTLFCNVFYCEPLDRAVEWLSQQENFHRSQIPFISKRVLRSWGLTPSQIQEFKKESNRFTLEAKVFSYSTEQLSKKVK